MSRFDDSTTPLMGTWDDLPYGFEVRPLDVWPGSATPSYDRRFSPFRAGMRQTLGQLRTELNALSAQDIVLQVDIAERDLRLDGRPRADAKAGGPGVILSMTAVPAGTRERIPLRYACDTFTDWRDNLRAIALGLEALRKVERYGIAKRGEQYTGWKALPPGSGVDSGVERRMTRREAEQLFLGFGNEGEEWAVMYRRAAAQLHPDVGGDREEWQRLQEAKAILMPARLGAPL